MLPENSISASKVNLMHVVRWRGCCSLGFEGASIIGRASYGNNIDDAALVTDSNGVSSLVEDNNDWKLGYIPLSSYAEVRESLHAIFTAI